MPFSTLIVTFHGIGSPPVAIPDDERPFWADVAEFEALVPEILRVARYHQLQAVFTFDDGNESDLNVAAPVLSRHDARAIFFPCTGRIGRPGYLDRHGLRDLLSAGFEIGSHGIEHLPWATLDREQLHREVTQSKAELERVTGRPCVAAALPFGSYRRSVLSALRQAGYLSVYSSDPGLNHANQWFNSRFSYRNDREFDIDQIVRVTTRPLTRALRASKGILKALR